MLSSSIQRSFGWLLLAGITALLPSASTSAAERPSGPKLLPDSALLYIRVNDVNEMKEKFSKTSVGRLSNDEKIKPLIGLA